MNNFYITTTLPYVNAEPHIGHALEFVQADALARYFRSKLGRDHVFFNVGTDEHGQKMYNKAKIEGLEPQAFVDKYAKRFQDYCELFFVDYDHFYRTSSPEHHKAAQEFWKLCDKKGDIYKKKYGGFYCVGCESYKTEKELVDGKCPDHNTEPVWQEEENYFFRLSKYRDQLLKYLEENPDFLKPEKRLSELTNFVKDIEDISISRQRENLPWGIEVPNDPSQVMYVWFDALTNYVNVVGFGSDEERLNAWWPGVQLCGPDNLRFQGAIWQGMLASAGLPQTRSLLVHGMVLDEKGTKMSKSIGNVISPFQQQEKYGAEVVRYYLLAGLTTFGDGPYSESDLINLYNSRLANNFGNLLLRVIHLAEKKGLTINAEEAVEPIFVSSVSEYEAKIASAYESYDLHLAAEHINALAEYGNKYIDSQKPWLAEDVVAEKILNNLSFLLAKVIKYYEPLIPVSSKKGLEILRNREKVSLFQKIEIEK